MKKLLFIISCLFIICACTKTQPESKQKSSSKPLPVSITKSACKINGYDCWTIIQDLKETKMLPVGRITNLMENPQEKQILQSNENDTHKSKISNPTLEEKGLFIVKYEALWNGSPTIYTLSNDVKISIASGVSKKAEYATVSGPSIKRTTYDREGNIVKF